MSTINDLIQNIQTFMPFKELSGQLLDFVADVKGKLWTVEILTKSLNDLVEQFSASAVATIPAFFKSYMATMFGENAHKTQKYCFTLLMSLLVYKERHDYLRLYFDLLTSESDVEVYAFFAETRRLCLNIRQVSEQKFTNLDGIYLSAKQWQIVVNKCLEYGVEQIKQFEADLQAELTRLRHQKVEKLIKFCRSGEYSLNFFLRECLRRFSGLHRQAVEERAHELEEYRRKVDAKLAGDYGPLVGRPARGRSTKVLAHGQPPAELGLEDEAAAKELEKQRLIEEIKHLTRATNNYKVSSAKLMGYASEIDPFFGEIKKLLESIREVLAQLKREKLNGKAFETVSAQATPQMLALLDRGSKLNARSGGELKKVLTKANPGFYSKLQQREGEFRPGIRKTIRDLRAVIFSDRFSITANRDVKNLEKVKDELEKLFKKFDKLENSDYLILDTVFRNYDSRNRKESVLDNAMNNAASKLGDMVDKALQPGPGSRSASQGPRKSGSSLPRGSKVGTPADSKASGIRDSSAKAVKESRAKDPKLSKASLAQEQADILKEYETSKAKYDDVRESLVRLGRQPPPGFGEDDEPDRSPQDDILSKDDENNEEDVPVKDPRRQSELKFQQSAGLVKSEDEERYVDRIQREAADLQQKQQQARQQDVGKGLTGSGAPRKEPGKSPQGFDPFSFKQISEDASSPSQPQRKGRPQEGDGGSPSPPPKRANNPFAKKKGTGEAPEEPGFEPINDNPFNRKSPRQRSDEPTDDFADPLLAPNKKQSLGPKDNPRGSFADPDKRAAQNKGSSREKLGHNFPFSPTFQNFDLDNSPDIQVHSPAKDTDQLTDLGREWSDDKVPSRQEDDLTVNSYHSFEQGKPAQNSSLRASDVLRLSQKNNDRRGDPVARSSGFEDSKGPGKQKGAPLESLADSRARPYDRLGSSKEKDFPAHLQEPEPFVFNPRLSGASNYNPRLSKQTVATPQQPSLRSSNVKTDNQRGSKIEPHLTETGPERGSQVHQLRQSQEKNAHLHEPTNFEPITPAYNFNPRLSESFGQPIRGSQVKHDVLNSSAKGSIHKDGFDAKRSDSKSPNPDESKRSLGSSLRDNIRTPAQSERFPPEIRQSLGGSRHSKAYVNDLDTRGSKYSKEELEELEAAQPASKQNSMVERDGRLSDHDQHLHRNSADSHAQNHRDSKAHTSQTLGDSQAEERAPRGSLKSDRKSSQPKINPSESGTNQHFPGGLDSRQQPFGQESKRPSHEDDQRRSLRVSKDRPAPPNPFDTNSGGTFVDSKPMEGSGGEPLHLRSQQASMGFPAHPRDDPNLLHSLKDSFGKYSNNPNYSEKPPVNSREFGKNLGRSGQMPELLSDVGPTSEKKNLPLFASFGDQRAKQKDSVVSEPYIPEAPKRTSDARQSQRLSENKLDPRLKESLGKKAPKQPSLVESDGQPVNLLLSSDPKERDRGSRHLSDHRQLAASQVEEPMAKHELRNLDSTGEINDLMDNVEVPSMLNSLQKSQIKSSMGSSRNAEGRSFEPKLSDAKTKNNESKHSEPKPRAFESKLSDPKPANSKLTDLPLDPRLSEITPLERPPFESKFSDLRFFEPKLSEIKPPGKFLRLSDPRQMEPEPHPLLNSKPSEPRLGDSRPQPRPSDPRLSDAKPAHLQQSKHSEPKPPPLKTSNPSLSQSDVNIIREQRDKAALRNLDSRGESDAIIPEAQASHLNSLSGRFIAPQISGNNTLNTTAFDNFDLFKQNLDKELDGVKKLDTLGQPSFMKSGSKISQPSDALKDLIDKNDKIEELENEDFLTDLKAPSVKERANPSEVLRSSARLDNSKNVEASRQPEPKRNVESSKYSQSDDSSPLRSIKRPKGKAVAQETGMSEPGDKSLKNYFKGFFGKRNE